MPDRTRRRLGVRIAMTGNTATSFPASTCSSKSCTRRCRAPTLSASTASAISNPLASRRRNTGATAASSMRARCSRALSACITIIAWRSIASTAASAEAILDRDAGPGERLPRRPRARAGWPDRILPHDIREHGGAEHGPRRRQLGHDPASGIMSDALRAGGRWCRAWEQAASCPAPTLHHGSASRP